MLEMQRRQNAAAGLLRRRSKRLDRHYSVDVMMQLYLTTVAPTASYGCDWGLRHMVAECRTGRNNLEASYIQTMRELCGVRRSVPAVVLLQELGELPLAVEWKRQALRFWSALTALPETSIFKQAAMDDLAAAQQSNTQNWAAGLLACAKQHGMALTGADGSMMAAADEGHRSRGGCRGRAGAAGVCGHEPEGPSGGVKRTTYAAWFSRPGCAQGGEFWQLELSAPQLRAVQRLRLGSHSLPVETGRFAKKDRLSVTGCCTFCDTGAVGDEKHLLMECPATDVVRQRFCCRFDLAVPPCTRQLVWGGDIMMVAEFMLGGVGLIGSSAQ